MSQGSTTLLGKGGGGGGDCGRSALSRHLCTPPCQTALKDGGSGGEENNNNYDKPLNFSMRRYGGRATTTSHCTTGV